MVDTERPPLAPQYDAFLSYSSRDIAVVRRIQRFIESYRIGTPKRRVRVYLDRTDIRGGELTSEIRTALERSARMVVCVSPAAIDSRWVAQEVSQFNEIRGAKAIAQALLEGDGKGVPFLYGVETRLHDLRRKLLVRFARPQVRIELLRLLAFITDVDLRTLRNWHLRRMLRNTAVVACALVASAWYPVNQWRELTPGGRKAIYPIAAEVRDGQLWVAARLRAAGPQGFRNYVGQIDDVLSSRNSMSYANREEFASVRRLLPVSLSARSTRSALERFDLRAEALKLDGRTPVGEPFVGQPNRGQFVAVQPISPTGEELDRARDDAADLHTPIPVSSGSLIIVNAGAKPSAAYVPSLNPEIYPPKQPRDPLSPSHGLSVAWGQAGEIWIGARGVDGSTAGGLWHSTDSGRTWIAVKDFASVSSISLQQVGDRAETVMVAESHFDRWQGISLVPYPSRVVARTGSSDAWTAVSMPPFGTRSEVELCGELNGAPVVRIDEKLFIRETMPLWRFVGGAL